jgi:sortase B
MRVSSREKIVFNMDSKRIREFISQNAQAAADSDNKDKRIIALATCAGANSTMKTVVFCTISE